MNKNNDLYAFVLTQSLAIAICSILLSTSKSEVSIKDVLQCLSACIITGIILHVYRKTFYAQNN